nr:MAG TPA: hypothetical protein [Microviridae sp.]
MANQFIIRVSQTIKQITPSGSSVVCAMSQVFQFENAFDFCKWLDEFRFDQTCQGFKRFRIDSIRVENFFSPWSKDTNRPVSMTEKEYVEWFNSLTR